MNANRRPLLNQRNEGGFTLVEIILVVMIVLILASVTVPRLVGRAQRARISVTKIAMNNIKTALGAYEVKTGQFPTTAQNLDALIHRPSDIPEDQWEKCLDDLPKDAWGHEFKYACPSEHGMDYDLISAGRSDGKFGTSDQIANYDTKSSGGSSSSGSGSGN